MLRHKISSKHVVFEGRRKLQDTDTLQEFDETACVSCLLSLEGDVWRPVMPEWKNRLGKTIREICDEGTDADGSERVFRRRHEHDIEENIPYSRAGAERRVQAILQKRRDERGWH